MSPVNCHQLMESYIEVGILTVADSVYNEIIGSPDAWQLVDDDCDKGHARIDEDLKPTTSARRIKALVEQVTGMYEFRNHILPDSRSVFQIDTTLYHALRTRHTFLLRSKSPSWSLI